MILPDVNILLYAFRRDDDRHSRVRRWLAAVVNGDAAYAVPQSALAPAVLTAAARFRARTRCAVYMTDGRGQPKRCI